jgi:trans-aconitate 2-methyltransferase
MDWILQGFNFPYGFFGPDEYKIWLEQVRLRAVRVELIQKEMVQPGIDGLTSWVESTWLPYIERVPEGLQRDFIQEIAQDYVSAHPLDNEGQVHVKMIRLEVEAEKPGHE